MHEVSMDYETVGRMLGLDDDQRVMAIGAGVGNCLIFQVQASERFASLVVMPPTMVAEWFNVDAKDTGSQVLVADAPTAETPGRLTMCYS